MTIADDYFRLRARGITLRLDGSRLRADSPQGVDTACQAIIRENAGEFVTWLWAPAIGPDSDNPNAEDAWHKLMGSMARWGMDAEKARKGCAKLPGADEIARGHDMYDKLWLSWAYDRAVALVEAGLSVRAATGRVLRASRSASPATVRFLRARAKRLAREAPDE